MDGESARKNERTILQALAERGQRVVADDMGLSESGVSRMKDPEHPLTAYETLALATCDGARALGLGDQIGSLEVGKQADVIAVDMKGPHLGPAPEDDPYVALIHSARASDVRLTMVQGRALYRDGEWTTLDSLSVLSNAWHEARGIERRVDAARAR